MRALLALIALLAGCVPAGTSQHGEALFLEGGDEAPPPPREELPDDTESTGAEENGDPPLPGGGVDGRSGPDR